MKNHLTLRKYNLAVTLVRRPRIELTVVKESVHLCIRPGGPCVDITENVKRNVKLSVIHITTAIKGKHQRQKMMAGRGEGGITGKMLKKKTNL